MEILHSKAHRIFLSLVTACLFLGICFAVSLAAPAEEPLPPAAPEIPGPVLSIPSGIPALPNATVEVPVSFTSNGNSIASMVFSIDYDEYLVYFDPSEPLSVTLNLPTGFAGWCVDDTTDLDGEIDCVIYDPIPPLQPITDRTIAYIKLKTKSPLVNSTAAVNFSANSPPTSYGDTNGYSVPGSTQNGSIFIDVGCPGCPQKVFLPLVLKAVESPAPPPGCTNLIQNGGFESPGYWEIPVTEYTAARETTRPYMGFWSLRTGIPPWDYPRFSYSSARQQVTIPWDATSVKLRFYEYSISGEVPYGSQLPADDLPALPAPGKPLVLAPDSPDLQYVIVLDRYDTIIEWIFTQLSNQQYWIFHQLGLLRYRNQTIKLLFGTYNDSYGGVTSMYVDNVELEVCR